MTSRRTAYVLALCTTAILVAMVVVAALSGASQEAHETYKPPQLYALGLVEHAGGLRMLLGLDVAFLVLYTVFFTAWADYLSGLGRPFARFGLGAIAITAILDIVEDHQILTALRMAEQDHPIDHNWIAVQQILSSTKFSISYLGLVLFGLAIPRTTRLGSALALYLVAGTLVTAIVGYAAPPEWNEALGAGRWISFVVGFALSAAWLSRAPDAPPAAAKA